MAQIIAKHGGLRRAAVLFSLFLLLVGVAASSPASPTPPPDAPTPAMLRAQSWTDKPVELLPREKEALSRSTGMQASMMCEGTYPFWFENKVVVLAYSLYRSGDDNWEIYTNTPCLAGSEQNLSQSGAWDYDPRLSPDAKTVVYVSDRDGNDEIYATSRPEGVTRRLTISPATDTMPAYSPDGKTIAFVSDRTGYPELYTMNSDGTGLAQLTAYQSNDVYPIYPDWSPDGARLVYTLIVGPDDEYGQIMVANKNGANTHAITTPLHLLGRVRWSPDNTTLALEYDADGDYWMDIGIIGIDGSGLWAIAGSGMPVDYQMGAWSAKGEGLVYTSLKYEYSYEYRRWFLVQAAQVVASCPSGCGRSSYSPGGYALEADMRQPDLIAPVSGLDPLPEFYPAYTPLTITWWAKDTGPAMLSYTSLMTRNPYASNWTWAKEFTDINTQEGHFETTLSFSNGQQISFTTWAGDRAGNYEPYHQSPFEMVTFYLWKAAGQVVDVRERPVPGALVTLDPAAMNTPQTGADGQGEIYFYFDHNTHQVSFTRAGFGSPAPQEWKIESNREFYAVLPGPDERVTNGQFAAQTPLEGWQAAGPQTVIETAGREGGKAAGLSGPCGDDLCLTAAQTPDAAPAGSLARDGQGTLHLLTSTGAYYSKSGTGDWQSGPALPAGTYSDLAAGPQNQLVAVQSAPVVRLYHKAGGSWTAIEMPSPLYYPPAVTIGGDGRIHAVYATILSGAEAYPYYASRLPAGSWSSPLQLDGAQVLEDGQPSLALLDNGSLVAAYRKNRASLGVLTFTPGETLEQPVSLDISGYYLTPTLDHPRVLAGGDGTQYLLARLIQRSSPSANPYQTQGLVYWVRPAGGAWPWASFFPATSRSGADSPAFGQLPWGDAALDADGNLHASYLDIFSTQNQVGYYTRSAATGLWTYKQVSDAAAPQMLDFALGADRKGYLLAGGPAGLGYRAVYFPSQSQQETLSQAITLPGEMQRPTLSFFYRFTEFLTPTTARLDVLVLEDGKSPVTLLAKQKIGDGWTHAWADLTPWRGKSVTLQFRLNQPAGEYPGQALVDEVTVSSWTRPGLSGVSPRVTGIIPAEGVWLEVQGENLGPGAQVWLDGEQASPVEYDAASGTLRAWLSPATKPGVHDLRVIALGGQEESLPNAVRVGASIFTPAIHK